MIPWDICRTLSFRRASSFLLSWYQSSSLSGISGKWASTRSMEVRYCCKSLWKTCSMERFEDDSAMMIILLVWYEIFCWMQSSSNIFWIAKNIEKNFQKQLIVDWLCFKFLCSKKRGECEKFSGIYLIFYFPWAISIHFFRNSSNSSNL